MSKSEKQTGAIPLYEKPWLGNSNPIWLGTTLSLARNIPNFIFPHLLKVDQQKQICTLLSNLLSQQKPFEGGLLKRGDECQALDKEYLTEHFFLPTSPIQAFGGVGFLLNSSGTLLSTFNLDNHLMIHGIETDGHFEKIYQEMIQCEEKVQKNLGFAFSKRFGYLTSQMELAGCGLKIRALLQLPALIHTKELIPYLESGAKEGIQTTSLFKEVSEWTLDIVAVENRFCLGITEDAILTSVKMFAEKLIDKETKKRLELIETPSEELRDKVSRAFAILKHSYQIDAKEAMNALSLIKLGLALNWVKGIQIDQLNELCFVIRRAHFVKMTGEILAQEQILHKRASFLHEKLKNLSLLET